MASVFGLLRSDQRHTMTDKERKWIIYNSTKFYVIQLEITWLREMCDYSDRYFWNCRDNGMHDFNLDHYVKMWRCMIG